MKKLIALLILACGLGVYAADSIVRTISLTSTGTTTADATYEARKGRLTSLIGVYQDVATDTNDCDAKIYLDGEVAGDAFLAIALANVTNTVAYQMVGEGDVTADINDILLCPGDTLWLDATGGAASNVDYKIVIRETKQ